MAELLAQQTPRQRKEPLLLELAQLEEEALEAGELAAEGSARRIARVDLVDGALELAVPVEHVERQQPAVVVEAQQAVEAIRLDALVLEDPIA